MDGELTVLIRLGSFDPAFLFFSFRRKTKREEEVNMELIEKRKRGGEKKKSFVCGNRRGEAEDFRCRILTVSGTEREKEIGEIEVYCSTLDVTISIFSMLFVLLFSRAARSLIVDSCNGFDSKWRKKGKRKEKENKTGLSRIGSFLSLSFFFPQLFLSSRHERG